MTQTPALVHKKESYHHGDLRQQLVTATRLLVESKGSMGFSVAEAAREAGVSSAAPYRHFKDRTAMLQAVSAQGMDRLIAAFDAATSQHPAGSVAAISALGEAYVQFAVAEPGVFRQIFAAHEEEVPELMALGAGCFGRLLAQVAAYYGQDPEAPLVAGTAFQLWTFVHGLSFLTIDCKTAKMGTDTPMGEIITQATRKLLAD